MIENTTPTLFELTPLALLAYDRQSLAILAVSDAALATYGYTRQELLTMTINDLHVADEVPFVVARLEQLSGPVRLGAQPSQPWRQQRRDGSIIEVELTSDDVELEGRACRILVCREVTEHNRDARGHALAWEAATRSAAVRSELIHELGEGLRSSVADVHETHAAMARTELSWEQRIYVEQIAEAVATADAYLAELLHLTPTGSSEPATHRSAFALRDLLERACRAARAAAAAKRIAFDLAVDGDLPERVVGDPARLCQALAAALGAAVSSTAEGAVSVRVQSLPRSGVAIVLRIEVAYSGLGIEPAVIESAPGPRVGPGARSSASGGLAVACALTELLGGRTGARHRVGLGSVVWLELPLEVVAPQPASTPGRWPEGGELRPRLELVKGTGRSAA